MKCLMTWSIHPCYFLCPCIDRSGACCSTVVCVSSVHLSVHESVCLHKLNMKTLHFPITDLTNLVTRLKFGMKAHLIDTHLVVPRSSSSAKVKVKYQGHVSQKMGVSGALVFHKHILFFWSSADDFVLDLSWLCCKELST